MEVLIKNCRLIDGYLDIQGDLYIKEGKIVEYGPGLDYACPRLDGKNLLAMPAFVELHGHFREPGYCYKEDLSTGSRAALKGGYTYVNLMANTKPIISSMDLVEDILAKAKDLDLIDIHQVVSITREFDGYSLDHLDSLDDRVRFISDDGFGVQSNLVMYQAMVKAREKDLIIIAHEEDKEIVNIDSRLAENLMTHRDLYLSQLTGAKLHLAHISTKEVVEQVREAKKENPHLSCEVSPHHFSLYDNDYRVNPPIREREDVEAIIGGIQDGTIDMIATDHAPHSQKDKEEGAPGISGLETAFALAYSYLVKEGHISLQKLSQLMSENPAKLAGIKKGRIKAGYDGDIVLVDLDQKNIVRGDQFVSKGKNTPFNGMELYGQLVATIRRGQVKYNGGVDLDNR